MKTQNLYRVLGCAPTATPAELKASYWRMARDNHPDRGGHAEAFQSLAHAYAILSDPPQRQAYDRERAAWMAQLGAVACPGCGDANRIGRVRAGQSPCCGHCGHQLPPAQNAASPWAEQARELVLDVGAQVTQQTRALALELGATLTDRTHALMTETVDRGFRALRQRLGLDLSREPRR